jgi:hypothetical protein
MVPRLFGCPTEEMIGVWKGQDIFIVPKASTGSGAHLVFSFSMSTRDTLPGDKVAEAWDWQFTYVQWVG